MLDPNTIFKSLCVLTVFGSASVQAECRTLEIADWLLGDWQANSAKSTTYESWHQISNTTFEGLGTTTRNDKAPTSETLRLVEMSGEIFYFAKVPHNPMPIAFKLLKCDHETLIFENTEHDFPQRLNYSKINDEQIKVFVSDTNNKGFELNFQRILKRKEN
jgi:hypothetical protein